MTTASGETPTNPTPNGVTPDEFLRLGVQRGIISVDQADALRALAREGGRTQPASELRLGFNWTTVAYVLGALLVLFACGWVLVSRWMQLGPSGVLGVTLVYAAALTYTWHRFSQMGFPRAAAVTLMLVVSLTPLVAWALLALVGEFPITPDTRGTFAGTTYAATRWLILDLATMLGCLLVLRRRQVATLALPLAAALWFTLLHVSQLPGREWSAQPYDRWAMLTGSLVMLCVADLVERWQRRESSRGVWHDFAGAFWIVGALSFAVSYMAFWVRSDGAPRHALPAVAVASLGLGLVIARRVLVVLGMLGVFGYLAYLADEVFKGGALFPVVLATLGFAMIAATVWTQRHLPVLAARLARGGAAIPWSPPLPWVLAGASLVLTLFALADAREDRVQREFAQRLHVLRLHSGSQRIQRAPPAPPRSDTTGDGRNPPAARP